jgi:hypothetical protein
MTCRKNVATALTKGQESGQPPTRAPETGRASLSWAGWRDRVYRNAMNDATLVLQRAKGGWRDFARAYIVVLDGTEAGKIKRGERVEIPVSPGDHEVFLRIDWARSPALNITAGAGEVVELACRPGGSSLPSSTLKGMADGTYITLTRVG